MFQTPAAIISKYIQKIVEEVQFTTPQKFNIAPEILRKV